jgi:hypothetical protein
MDSLSLVLAEVGLADTRDVMPGLPQKIVLDIVNSINVVQDIERIQCKRSRLRHRLIDSITGAGANRQKAVNENHTEAIRGVFDFAVGLAKSIEFTNSAVTEINKQLQKVHNNIEDLATDVYELHERLKQHIDWSQQRINQLQEAVTQVAIEERANKHLERVIDKWAAGRLGQYSPLSQLYIVIDDLFWGCFGELCKSYPDSQACKESMDHAQDKLLIQLQAQMQTQAPIELAKWIPGKQMLSREEQLTLAYMGDWTNRHQYFPRTATSVCDEPAIGIPLQFDCALAVGRMWKQSMEVRLHE